jgi:hypothetical protein
MPCGHANFNAWDTDLESIEERAVRLLFMSTSKLSYHAQIDTLAPETLDLRTDFYKIRLRTANNKP